MSWIHDLASVLALLTTTGAVAAAQDTSLRALEGDWLFVEDRSEGRVSERRGPPMSMKFSFRVEKDALVMLRGQGSRKREERIPLDGSVLESRGKATITRRRGVLEKGVVKYETKSVHAKDKSRVVMLVRREFRPTPEGLQIRVVFGSPPTMDSVALYRHPKDIALPKPAKASCADISWLAGAWSKKTAQESTEERWSPAKGGALLGVSRSIRRGRMVAFEYLRIVERAGGLVYIAQPGGGKATAFVLTELGAKRAVFENPRHDFPQRIV